MDSRLEQALSSANYKTTLYLEKKRLQEKAKAALTLFHNGGRFFVDRTLISFLNVVTPEEGTNSIVIFDDGMNPIRIGDLTKFRSDVINLYCTVANQHFLDINDLKKKRTTKAVVDL